MRGSTADDVAKETAIFRAHKATPIVIADEGETRFLAAATISVPPVDPELGFVLSAMVGHLFGYEAALAIDTSALPLRQARELIERAVGDLDDGDAVLASIRRDMPRLSQRFLDGMRDQVYDGHLEASTAVRLVGLLRDPRVVEPGRGVRPLDGQGRHAGCSDRRTGGGTDPRIEELTRPIDAIKHQAKTVTVGISRSDEGIIDRLLVQATLDAGAGRDVLAYRTLKILADLAPPSPLSPDSPATASTATWCRSSTGADLRDLTSRVDRDSRLLGTKHRVAESRERARRTRPPRPTNRDSGPRGQGRIVHGNHPPARQLHDRLDVGTMRASSRGTTIDTRAWSTGSRRPRASSTSRGSPNYRSPTR